MFERKAPVLMTHFHYKLEHVYLPRLKYALAWVPYASRYLPLEQRASSLNQSGNDSARSSSAVVHQNNAFATDRDAFEVYHMKPENSVHFDETAHQSGTGLSMNLVEDFYN